MKRFLIIAGVVIAIAALVVFNKMTSKSVVSNTYTEVKKGAFEITVTNSGELLAERSLDIRGPEMGQQQNQQQGGQQVVVVSTSSSGGQQVTVRSSGGSGGGMGGGGGMSGGGGMGGGRGSDMRAADLKILDIVPEGTIVKKGDYIAQLDKSSYENNLRDQLTSLTTARTSLEMAILDTAVTLSGLRDGITNQQNVVEEAKITLAQSLYESPSVKRQAQLSVDKAERTLEQKVKSYQLSIAKLNASLLQRKLSVSKGERLIADLQDYIAKFTVTAPSDGMVIYKKDRNGSKRKAGSSINAFDLVIATLPDLSSMLSKTYVNEIEVSKIQIGQKVNINVDAFPEKAFTGSVMSIANIGEVLPNSDSKMFEVQIKVDGSDPALRPTMTTGNKIILKTYNDVVYVPSECVQAGLDSITFVYEKKGTKQIVLLGESNDKNVIVEQGLTPGTILYITTPTEPEKFKLVGENLIQSIKERK
jgi:HlyD family secretion protein